MLSDIPFLLCLKLQSSLTILNFELFVKCLLYKLVLHQILWGYKDNITLYHYFPNFKHLTKSETMESYLAINFVYID
jgi:hypothetical protein